MGQNNYLEIERTIFYRMYYLFSSNAYLCLNLQLHNNFLLFKTHSSLMVEFPEIRSKNFAVLSIEVVITLSSSGENFTLVTPLP